MAAHSLIVPLEITDVHRMRLKWASRYSQQDLAQVVNEAPGLSQWMPRTGEYLIAGRWRHRDEVVAILEVTTGPNTVRLIDHLAEAAAAQGKRLIVIHEQHERRSPLFYAEARMSLLEQILVYEAVIFSLPQMVARLRFERVTGDDPFVMGELLELDHQAFSWLWWNSEDEFSEYLRDPRVDIYLGRDQHGAPVSYVGITRMRGWGHLDRLAVAPAYQGLGYGRESLEWAVQVLGSRGARRVALSTQARNARSRRMYERFGFRRVPSFDYDIYGRWLGEPVPLD
uniref:GNAT family N-acetyltransferase n=2 Tax=Thermorudis TaxID=1649508 RepID=A0A7C2WB86_9BACT